MYYMVLLVLDKVERAPDILEAWDATGVGGITILESTGLGRARRSGIRDDLPLMPSLVDFLKGQEERHRTLFTVVEGEQWVDLLIETTESIIGDMEEAANGVLFVLPVARVAGLHGAQERARGGK